MVVASGSSGRERADCWKSQQEGYSLTQLGAFAEISGPVSDLSLLGIGVPVFFL
jgi:hypothetical protein